MGLPCSVWDLIPQKGKMGFDQTLVKTKTDDLESTAIINQGNIFLDDYNQLSNIVLIEYINQLIAAVHRYNGKANNQPERKGLFVGIQEAEFYQPAYLGDILTLKGFVAEEVSQVTFFQGFIERDGDRIAQLVTKIYEVKEAAEFDSLTNGGKIPQQRAAIQVNRNQPPVYLTSSMDRKLYTYLHDITIGVDNISFKIACPEDFDAFDGHFPKNPILPGIVLLEIAKLALEVLLKKPVAIIYLKKMKISGVVLPNQVISGTVKIDRESGPTLSFSAVFEDGSGCDISRFSGTCDEGKR